MLLREKLERVRAERRRLYEERFAEGYAAGVAEVRRLWVPWYERFKAARQRGEPFDEPPPHKR